MIATTECDKESEKAKESSHYGYGGKRLLGLKSRNQLFKENDESQASKGGANKDDKKYPFREGVSVTLKRAWKSYWSQKKKGGTDWCFRAGD